MAFVIENSGKYPLVTVRMLEPVEKDDAIRLLMSLRDWMAKRKANTSVYLALNLLEIEDEIPLIQVMVQFAKIYQEFYKQLQLEILVSTDVSLTAIVRYLAESLSLPIQLVLSHEALHTYVERRCGDTQPIRPELLAQAAETLNVFTKDE
jgi:hypothetical protein